MTEEKDEAAGNINIFLYIIKLPKKQYTTKITIY